LRNGLLQIGAVLHHHAAGHDEALHAAAFAVRDFENRIDRLLLGGVDEAAGVDDDDVRGIEIVRDLDLGFLAQLAEHDLAVDEIFRAAEGDHPHARDGLCDGGFYSHEQPWNRAGTTGILPEWEARKWLISTSALRHSTTSRQSQP